MDRQLLNLVLYSALALASFFTVAAGVRSLLPWPEGLGLQAKMEYFDEHYDEFDAVIIGSSRSFRGIDPRIFDADLARAGHPIRTFNLALGGMRTFEQDFLLHYVVGLEPARLRWIFFEGGPVGMGLREDHVFREPNNLWSQRGVLWHTPAVTARVLRSLWRLPMPLLERLERGLEHIEILGWHMANYGKGEELLARWRMDARARELRAEANDRIAEGRGHQGLQEASGRETSDELDELLEDPTPFRERMAAIPVENAMDVPLAQLNVDVHREQLAAARRIGATLIYFTPPGYEGTPERLRLHEAGILPRMAHFNDPERYPELFQLDHRYDKGHLNRRGVEVLSHAFARAVLPYLEESESAETR